MRVLSKGRVAQPSFLLFLLVLTIVVQVSAVPAADTTTDAQTTADPSTTDSTPSVSSSTTSTETTSTTTSTTTSSTSTSTTTMATTTTSDTSTSTSTSTSSDTSTTSSVSTTTTSTSSSSTSTGGAIVTIPPTANAPYMQTSNTPEGTVFIAVGAILGFIGLAVLAWRGMVAWSVNRSVRRAALASAENKRLMRGSRKKRGTTVYTAAPAGDVSLEKLGAATRASVKPSRRVPSSNSGLFFSPTAGGAGSHNSNLSATGNRGSTYLPSGYYATAGGSTPVRDVSGSHADLSSPSLPNVSAYDPPHNQRSSYMGGSTSSLNLSQAPQGRAPSAYLEDLFENHTPPSNSDRRHPR